MLVAAGAGLLGALIGSFLNVVIHRVPRGESVVAPPSACPGCGTRLRARDNIPFLSWLILGGRCRTCSARISPRYPIVELAGALAFAGVAVVFAPAIVEAQTARDATGAAVVMIAHFYFAGLSIALTAIDLDEHRLPDRLVLPAYLVAGGALLASAVITFDLEAVGRTVAGAGILFGLYLLIASISPRGMGMGDVKLAGVIGLYLGYAGWAPLIVGSFAAFLLGGVVGILLLIARRARRGSGIPFGPWMLGGAWIGLLWGDQILRSYLALFGIATA